ncbi:MAG: hypothetical protein ACYCW5_01395 [Thermoleophilia bacterium]
MEILEWMMLTTSLLIAPFMVVIIVAFLRGCFEESEELRHLPINEGERDYWSEEA